MTWIIAAAVLAAYITCAFFVSRALRRNDFADVAWGPGFLVLTLTGIALSWPEVSDLAWIRLVLVGAWALRLAFYVSARSQGRPEDPRYQGLGAAYEKSSALKSFLKVYLLQGTLLYGVGFALFLPLPELQLEGWAAGATLKGISLALIGLLIETIADLQKLKGHFRSPTAPAFFEKGLWKYSRHPNYFGELLFWWGVGIFNTQGEMERLPLLIGPALLTFLLLKVSGIPLIVEKQKTRPRYAEYVKRTRLLVPLPLFRGKRR